MDQRPDFPPDFSMVVRGIFKAILRPVPSLALVVLAGTALSLVNASASEDVRHTKHNLAVNPDILAGEGNDFTPGDLTSIRGARNPAIRGIEGDIRLNEEVCIFCHTPHGGRSNVNGAVGHAPLWN
ncbi:MAG: hypothetical protein ACE5HN_09265, partial [Nitrospiria bacterium]